MSLEEAKAVIKEFVADGSACGRSKDEIREALMVATESIEQLERLLWAYLGTKLG